LWRGEVLRKSLDTYKKKIDANHNILFSYNIAIEYLDFLVDENLLKFFDEAGHLLRFMTFELYIKVENKFFVGLIQSSLHGFDSFAVTKNNYYEGEEGLLKLFAFFDPEKTSYKKIKKCKNILHDYQTFSTHVAVVNLVVKDFSIDFAYYEKVL
jgi:hypothetical protein